MQFRRFTCFYFYVKSITFCVLIHRMIVMITFNLKEGVIMSIFDALNDANAQNEAIQARVLEDVSKILSSPIVETSEKK